MSTDTNAIPWSTGTECDCGAELDRNGRCFYCDAAWIWVDDEGDRLLKLGQPTGGDR